ncbi:MAG: protein jag, partial [Microlunatus sp.]|nr:protein jag [Microlunatus sp.]
MASGGIDSADPEGGDAASGDTGNGDTEDDNPLEVEAEVAADYLEELLDIADLDGDID